MPLNALKRSGAKLFMDICLKNVLSVCCLENSPYKGIQMCMDRVVAMVSALNNVPYMRNAVLVKVVVVALRSIETNNVVLCTACDEQEVGLILGIAPLERALCTGSCTYSAYIAKLVTVLHAYLERLTSAH